MTQKKEMPAAPPKPDGMITTQRNGQTIDMKAFCEWARENVEYTSDEGGV